MIKDYFIVKDGIRKEYFAPSKICINGQVLIKSNNSRFFPIGSLVRVYTEKNSSIRVKFNSGKEKVYLKDGIYHLARVTRAGTSRGICIPKFLRDMGLFDIGERIRVYPFVPLTVSMYQRLTNKQKREEQTKNGEILP